DCSSEIGLKLNGQAFVAGVVVVRARVFITRAADQDAARHQLVGSSADAIAKGALAHVGHREAIMELGIRTVPRSRRTAVVINRDAILLEEGCAGHQLLWPGWPVGSRRATLLS